jgi:hypothetical protein
MGIKMKKYALILIPLILFVSCIFGPLPNDGFSNESYFYYSDSRKIYFKLSLTEVYIAFEDSIVTTDMADSILSEYEFLSINDTLSTRYLGGFRANVCETCNDSTYKNYLKKLNRDNGISSATPIFYFSENDPDSYCIMISEVRTKFNEEIISESDFIRYAETFNLELISTGFSWQTFKIKDVKTGFEALEIANEIYECDKSIYSLPDFIANISFE